MAQTPITQAQWRAVVDWQTKEGERLGKELDPASSGSQGDISRLLERETNPKPRPMEWVSWLDAQEFCRRLNQRTGQCYGLPSEAQWDYTCRAGSTTPFHFGATLTLELANYDGNYVYAEGPEGEYRKQATPVGIFPANAWGLHEMHGNVYEWCLDHWHHGYEGTPADGSAWLSSTDQQQQSTPKAVEVGTDDSEPRLLRGASWGSLPRYCRSAARGHGRPGDANDDVGFRVVCLPQGPSLNS